MAAKDKNGQQKEKITALYSRLSQDDGREGESSSISNQKEILMDYARKHGFLHPQFFVDDGIPGTTFDRPDFQRIEMRLQRSKMPPVMRIKTEKERKPEDFLSLVRVTGFEPAAS